MSAQSEMIDSSAMSLSQLLTLLEMKNTVQMKMAQEKKELKEANALLTTENQKLLAIIDDGYSADSDMTVSITELQAVIAAIKAIVEAPIANPVIPDGTVAPATR